MTVVTDDGEATLEPYDSVYLAPERGPLDREPHEPAGIDARRHALPAGQAMTSAQSLFDVSGKSALVTGATGAFGQMAARTLAEAGAKVTLAAGTADALAELGAELRDSGAAVETVPRRAEDEADAEAMVERAVSAHGGIDLVVTAAGINKIGLATEQPVEDWQSVIDANVKGTWLVCRAAGRRMIDERHTRQVRTRVLDAQRPRPSGRLHGVLRLEGRGQPADEGAGLRVGGARDQRQRDCADRVPVAADRVDVRRRRDELKRYEPGSSRGSRSAG